MSDEQLPVPTSVYGPVASWRFGQSLGIDPIGSISTCSFNCVYCQLGDIQQHTAQRQVFVPTHQIIQDLEAFAPWTVDVVTLSGSGEPTLALNLGEILAAIQTQTGRPSVVLTNSTLLQDAAVRQALALADIVAAKLDATSSAQLQRINRPVAGIDWANIIDGIAQFRAEYAGQLAIQTMLLAPWSEAQQTAYIDQVQTLSPDEIQLNFPSRPRPLSRQLDSRGHGEPSPPFPTQPLKPIHPDDLQAFADRIQAETSIPVRCAPRLEAI